MKKYHKVTLVGITFITLLLLIGIKPIKNVIEKRNIPIKETTDSIISPNVDDEESGQDKLKKEEIKNNVENNARESIDTTTNSNKSTNSNKPSEKDNQVIETPKPNVALPEEKVESNSSTNQTNDYIGVSNPKDFYYSFHHGKIEYSSMESCLAEVPIISLKNTIDIQNSWCIDVVDGQGAILGQFLYINCLSGNCDKYK